MKATWQDDLQALREERRLLLTNLRILRQRSIKEGRRASISTYYEIEDTQAKLKEVEDGIRKILSRHTDAALELERSPFEESPYVVLDSANAATNPDLDRADPLGRALPADYIWGVKKSWLVLGALAAFGMLALLVWGLRGRSAGALDETISIQLGYYHLGDAPISEFHNVYPDQNPFIARFDVPQPVAAAQLSLMVSHMDPDEKQSPVIVTINGNFVSYLNSYVREESLRAETIVIPVDPEILVVGTNELKVEVLPTSSEYGLPNIDDLEFWDLKLLLK
jgi:hypothetical protein